MYLSNGKIYQPGEGAIRAEKLHSQPDLPADIIAMYVAQAHQSIDRYGRVPGATIDLFVADLIDRGIITNREVALALLGESR